MFHIVYERNNWQPVLQAEQQKRENNNNTCNIYLKQEVYKIN